RHRRRCAAQARRDPARGATDRSGEPAVGAAVAGAGQVWRLIGVGLQEGVRPMGVRHVLLASLLGVGLTVGLMAAFAASAGAQATILYDKIEIRTDKLAPNLYMLSGSENVDSNHPDGAGGRIGVLSGPDGIFMVD